MKNKKKIILFSLIVNVLIIIGLELGAGYWLQNKTIYAIPGLIQDKHPFMEFDKDLGYRIRKKVFSRSTDFFPIITPTGQLISTKLAFTEQEGIIRNEHGDILINDLGFRGPFFQKKRDRDTFRIVALGGSTTAGMYENELELFYKGVKSPKDNLVAINEDKVIVDGNNVARHPNISPTIANLISMKKALEEKGISTKRIKIENQTRFAIREGGRTVGAGVVSKIIK